jgi:MFS family permease
LTYAAVQIVFSLPMILLGVPTVRSSERLSTPVIRGNDAPHADQHVAQRREVRLFLLLAAALTLASTVMSVVSVHLLTILQTARGLDLAAAVTFGAMVGPSQVGARVIEMTFGRRYHAIWTLVASVTLVALGLGLLSFGFPVIAIALVAYGAGNGLNSIARGSLPLALFGPSRYAIWMGRLAAPTLIASAVSPAIGALLIDSIGSARTLLAIFGLAVFNILGVSALIWESR